MDRIRRLPFLAAVVALAVPAAAIGHDLLDHPMPSRSDTAPPSPAFQSGGEGATWEPIGTIFTGNPHTDLDFFSAGGETYAAVGTLAAGANGGGVTIVKLVTRDGKVQPEFVTGHPSASCLSNPSAALALQHDIEVTPKPASAPLNTPSSVARLGDAQMILDATDAAGRCHDQGLGGIASAPKGGIEIVDVSEGADQPKEIGLTSHIGEAHTVNVDPKRPHIAYAVTSDSVSVDAEGKRANEEPTTNATGQDTTSSALDGFEVIDLSSCMGFPAGTTLERKRERCKPQVYRYRYPSAAFAQGHAADDAESPFRGVYACHELEVYPDDRLTCASGAASLLFDMSGAFDDNGTPADFTDDKPRGTPLPCAVRASSTAIPEMKTGAPVTDCAKGAEGVDLRVPGWKAIGSPSLEGVRHLGTARHIGRAGTGSRAKFDSTQDIDFSHEAELTHSGRYLIASDERGGGVAPPGAACDTPDTIKEGNGGLHFYDVSRLQTAYTGSPEEAWQAYAKRPDGSKAIYRAPVRTGAQATICTAHVFQQIPGQNRIFMGWYSQGTQVVDYVERPDGTLELKDAGYFIPAAANQWVSAIYKVEANPDGTFTYYGATGDFAVSEGRNAIDLYKVTLPGPPRPRLAGASAPAAAGPAPTYTYSSGSSRAPACAAATGIRNATARPRGRGLRFAFRGTRAVDVDVFRTAKPRRVHAAERVARFRDRRGGFTWRARGLRDGVYVVRYRVRGNRGGALAQRVAVQRRRGRFSSLRAIERRTRCDAIARLALDRPAFGGRTAKAARLVARFTRPGTVAVKLVRGGKVVRTLRARAVAADRTRRLTLSPRGLRRGRYLVRVTTQIGHARSTTTLGVLRL